MSWRELEPDHPLGALADAPLGEYRLKVLGGPQTRTGAQTFGLRLRRPDGLETPEPFLIGVFRRGRRPAETWVEVDWVDFKPVLTGPEGRRVVVDLEAEGLLEGLFGRLAQTLPPGGSLMVEYANPRWQETARALGLGVPPAATELGLLLVRAGCFGGFKDWYFAEGGWEGPRKLQAFRPDPARAAERVRRLIEELEKFVPRSEVTGVGRWAREALNYLKGLVEAEIKGSPGRPPGPP